MVGVAVSGSPLERPTGDGSCSDAAVCISARSVVAGSPLRFTFPSAAFVRAGLGLLAGWARGESRRLFNRQNPGCPSRVCAVSWIGCEPWKQTEKIPWAATS